MANTKLKGHRIAEKALEDKHFKDDVVFEEGGRVALNFPTHSNEADLTLDEKNTLTQLGNADSLHYHTGGGGGPQGIYTNEERDAQLLRLNLLVNSSRYGIDRSVRDSLENDDTIDYGIYSAPAPHCIAAEGEGVLPSETEYTYAVAYCNKYGSTNITASTTVKTGTGLNNAVYLTLRDVPAENTGFEVYRTTDKVSIVVGEFDVYNRFINNEYIRFYLDNGDKTSGLSSLNLRVKGVEDNREYYSPMDLLYGNNKIVSQSGEQLNTIIYKQAPYSFTIFNMNRRKTVNRLDLIWGPEINLVPSEYEVYYTDDENAVQGSSIQWKRLSTLTKRIDYRNRETNMSTDGDIVDNIVSNNSRAHNSFYLGGLLNVSAIRIVVKDAPENVRLYAVRAFSEQQGDYRKLIYKFDNPIDINDYESLSFDIKSNGDNRKLLIALSNSEDSDVTNVTKIVNYNYQSSLHGQQYTTYRAYINTAWGSNYDKYDKMRIGIRAESDQYIEFDNVHMLIGSTATSSYYSFRGMVNVPVTFNGSYEYKGVAPSDGLIWSDWFECPWSSSNYNNYSTSKGFTTSLYLKAGRLSCYGSGTTYYSKDMVGYEDVEYLGDISVSSYGSSFVQQVEIATSSSKRIDAKANFTVSTEDHHQWQRHLVKLNKVSTGTTYDTLTIMALDGFSKDQVFMIDNIRATRKAEIITGVTPIGSSGFKNLSHLITDDTTYAESAVYPAQLAPQSFGLSFNGIQSIDNIKLMFGDKSAMATNYAIQYTDYDDADINAAFNDSKWFNVQNLQIGDEGLPQLFTGQIANSMVYNNNLYAHMVNHRFNPIMAKAIRVIVFGTYSTSKPVKCLRMAAYNHCEYGEFKLIYKHNGKIADSYQFKDDGKPTQEITSSQFNTTGTHGIMYDKSLRLAKLIDGVAEGTLYFNTIKMPLYRHVLMTAQYTGDVTFYVSNDTGTTFHEVPLERLLSFTSQSETLTVKAVLRGSGAAVNAIAFLYTL